MIYFVLLEKPIGNPSNRHGTAQIYCGYCDDERLDERLKEHRMGYGSKMLAEASRRGINFDVCHVEAGDRTKERKIKNQKNHRRYLRRQGVVL